MRAAAGKDTSQTGEENTDTSGRRTEESEDDGTSGAPRTDTEDGHPARAEKDAPGDDTRDTDTKADEDRDLDARNPTTIGEGDESAPLNGPGEQPSGPEADDQRKQDDVVQETPDSREHRAPAQETSENDPADSVNRPDDDIGPAQQPDARAGDHGVLDTRVEDVERSAETGPSDGKDAQSPPATGERINDARTGTKTGRETEPPELPVPPEGETNEPDPVADGEEHSAPETEMTRDAPSHGPQDGTSNEPGDGQTDDPAEPEPSHEPKDPYAHLPTRADLDPVGAGAWLPHRGELTPVNENQDLREPAPERDSDSKRAMRGLNNNVEDALKGANAINDDLQGPLGGHRSPSDFPTGTKDTTPTMKAPDNPAHIPRAVVGVISAAMVLYSAGRGAHSLATGLFGRRNDRD